MELLWNKILPVALLPVGVALILMFLAWVFRWRLPAFLALGVLGFSSLPIVADNFMRTLENRYPAVPVAEAPVTDAIVVLSGMLGEGRTPRSLEFHEAIDRFESALALHAAGRAPVIVFTGGVPAGQPEREPEGQRLRRLALSRGVPDADIVVTGRVGNTAAEAHALAELAASRGWKRFTLVTTAWHLPRAIMLFQSAGLDVIPFPSDYRTSAQDEISVLSFLPGAYPLEKTETTLREYYGMAFYWLF